jgi:hypothetical protein
MRDCHTTDELLFAFVDGIEPDLESHVATCEHCQEFLAELWIGELQTDLSESVLRRIRFDEFLREVGQLTMDVAVAMGKAAIVYGPGVDEQVGNVEDGAINPTKLSPDEDDEE